MAMDIATHKNILIRVLKEIYTRPNVGQYLGFKGGTAVYLFYNLGRFSVDLDFDLLEESKVDVLFENLRNILAEFGTLKEAQNKNNHFFYLLSYDNKIEGARNVKVEVNKRSFGSQYEVKTFLGIPMKVMIQEDMAAHKMVAMSERVGKTNRDIYDVWFLLKNRWSINKDIIEKRTGLSYKDFLTKSIQNLEKVSPRNILSGMGELLNPKQKSWVKSNLIKDVLFLLKCELESEK